MEEKILMKSKKRNMIVLSIGCFIIAIIAFFAFFIYDLISWVKFFNGWYNWDVNIFDRVVLERVLLSPNATIAGIIIAAGLLSVGVWCFGLSKIELTVTDKRVYGKAIFGRRIDLPLDKISAVGLAWPKAISVATSSGRVTFFEIINRDEIYECINNLLIERQGKAKNEETKQEIHHVSGADELKKYKDLLNEGIITQEEFEAKKKQILGI